MFGSFASKTKTATPKESKKQDAQLDLTPLERMLVNAGPIRPDDNDKFYGLENFGNTCYCNSIVQALYYSLPFRESILTYPPIISDSAAQLSNKALEPPVRTIQNADAASPANKALTAADAMKRREAINKGQVLPPVPGQRPEDKPDSPEYKKKQAMIKGPILDMTFDNAATYGMEETTFTALKDIFTALTTTTVSRVGVLSPSRLLEIFKRDNEMFRTAMHQDAHEFYGLVVNSVITSVAEAEEQRKGARKMDESTGVTNGMFQALSNAASAIGLTNGSSEPATTWVRDIFEGLLTSETKCLTCETASQRDEVFLDLSIDLGQNTSVTSCLRKFSAEEMLCERNKFHCDSCGGLQEAEKRMKIKRLPKILALHLKRFKYSDDMTRLEKLFHRVVYPYQLRMFNTMEETEDPDRIYELYAVVVHIGANAYHGHYVSIIKTPDRGWLLFDDEMVEPVDKNYVLNFFGDRPGQACAYVLFYQETTLEKIQKEQEAEGHAQVSEATLEAGAALGNAGPNGTYINSSSKRVPIPATPGTPLAEEDLFRPLDHAVSTPISPTSAPSRPILGHIFSNPSIPILSTSKMDRATKDEKEKEKKESKEAEKARKVLEKERVKVEMERRKDVDKRRIEYTRQQAEQLRTVIAASKASATEDDERRKRDAALQSSTAVNSNALLIDGQSDSNAASPTSTHNSPNNHINGPTPASTTLESVPEDHESNTKSTKTVALSRHNKNSRSMSGRKSFFGLSRSNTASSIGVLSEEMAVEDGNGVAATSSRERERHEVPNGGMTNVSTSGTAKKERFSFSLGRKKSNLL